MVHLSVCCNRGTLITSTFFILEVTAFFPLGTQSAVAGIRTRLKIRKRHAATGSRNTSACRKFMTMILLFQYFPFCQEVVSFYSKNGPFSYQTTFAIFLFVLWRQYTEINHACAAADDRTIFTFTCIRAAVEHPVTLQLLWFTLTC